MKVIFSLVAIFFAMIAAARIDMYDSAYYASKPLTGGPAILRFIGEGRSMLSYMSILKADRYFHGGVADKDQTAAQRAEMFHYATKHNGGPAEKADGGAQNIPPYNILFRLAGETTITEHRHLTGNRMKEILPWLYYSVKLDPSNVMGYTLIGYYLCDRFGKTDEALRSLREGLANNPDSWKINAEIGRIYLFYAHNRSLAVTFLSRAYDLMKKRRHDRFQERYVLSFLAEAYKEEGKMDKVLPLYKKIHDIFPGDTIYKKKIEKCLKAMGKTAGAARGEAAIENVS